MGALPVPSGKRHAVDLETVVCPVCHATESTEYLRVDDRGEAACGFRLVKCARCGLVYLNPRPSEEDSPSYYSEASYLPFVSAKSPATAVERLYHRLRKWNCAWKRKQIEKMYSSKGTLLDIGCGTGEFLEEMRAAGWQVRGVERDPGAVAYAIEQLRLNVFVGSVEGIPAVEASYDVITMWHVLEHLYEPHPTLVRIRDLLKADGLLVIAVPNLESVDAAFYRQNWVAFDAPRHLQHFSLKTLQVLLGMHKFDLVRHATIPLDAVFNALMSERKAGRDGGTAGVLLPLRLLRGLAVAKLALTAAVLKRGRSRYRGSTLLTFWHKGK